MPTVRISGTKKKGSQKETCVRYKRHASAVSYHEQTSLAGTGRKKKPGQRREGKPGHAKVRGNQRSRPISSRRIPAEDRTGKLWLSKAASYETKSHGQARVITILHLKAFDTWSIYFQYYILMCVKTNKKMINTPSARASPKECCFI